MVKSVNDTNVWVAGIHWQTGAGYKILLHWQQRHFQTAAGDFVAGESTVSTTTGR